VAKKPDANDRRRRVSDMKAQQKKAERRTTYIFVAVAALAAAALIGGAVTFGGGGGGRLDVRTLGEKEADAKCGEVEVASTPPTGQHVDGAVNYATTPPTGGDHSGSTAPANRHFYDRDGDVGPERLVHNLEHGYVVAWYDEQASDDEINALRTISKNVSDAGPSYGRKFIVAPHLRGNFEGDNNVAISAWGASQLCGEVSGEAIDDFLNDFRGPDGPKSTAPEKGNA